jgi:hypothetical protein
LTFKNTTDNNAETLLIIFPTWDKFRAESGGGKDSLTKVKVNYVFDPSSTQYQRLHTYYLQDNTYVWKDGQTGKYAAAGWSIATTYLDPNQKKLFIDVTRTFSATGADANARTFNFKTSDKYKLKLNWMNFTYGSCTGTASCTTDPAYRSGAKTLTKTETIFATKPLA